MKNDKPRKRRLPRNPYLPLHKKLVEFATTSELDPELVIRNEFLRLENMILRSLFLEKRSVCGLRMRKNRNWPRPP